MTTTSRSPLELISEFLFRNTHPVVTRALSVLLACCWLHTQACLLEMDTARGDSGNTAITPAANEATGLSAKTVERVQLGSPDLTNGIPGVGPLTTDQIRDWLEDPRRHVPLDVQLPLGLRSATGQIHIPPDDPLTRAKIELGRQLFFDKRLSGDGTISCADCHRPEEGFTRHTQFGVGVDGLQGTRNPPGSYNRILSAAQFWDGRAASLEEQAVGPIANPLEMGNTHDFAVATIREIPGYRLQFEDIFPDGVTIANIGRAIACFERAIVSGSSPYDHYESVRTMRVAYRDDLEDLDRLKQEDPELHSDYVSRLRASERRPMSDSAKRGREIFFTDKGNCSACHVGANLSDEAYHNIGVGMDRPEPDPGRYAVTGEDKDRGAFKTPTIRNVALTAPYMHDGSLATLEEVVEWYARGGYPNPNLSDKMTRLQLTEQDKADLVAFMQACTGDFPAVARDRLPE